VPLGRSLTEDAEVKVQLRLAELHVEVVNALTGFTTITLEEHDRRLAELSRLAQQKGQMGAAINAEVKRGELARLRPSRSEPKISDTAPAVRRFRRQSWYGLVESENVNL